MRPRQCLRTALGALALAAALASCAQDASRPAALASGGPPAVEPPGMLDDFELDPGWTLDSANDYAALSFTEQAATTGKLGMRVDFSDNGRDKAVLRKEVDLDCSGVERLMIDA